MASSLSSFHVLVLILLELCSTAGVNGCSVTPSSAAVVAGDNLSLTCTTFNTSQYILYWRLESDAISAFLLYQSPILAIGVNREVAVGYLANDSNPEIQVILTIVKASKSQANYYYCLCTGSTSDFAYVSVLESEPTFSNSTEIIDGEPVIFSCNVSFNGIVNTSIAIEDGSGNILKTTNYDGSSKGLHSFSLNYSVIADSRISQEYHCNIKLTNDTSRSLIFSRNLNASVQWGGVQNAEINPIDGTQCMNGQKCSLNQTVRCTAEGNPKPAEFQWLASVNGSGIQKTETSGDIFNFTTTGRYLVQCIASNQIAGTRHNSSSNNFSTQVVNESLYYSTSGEQYSGGDSKTLTIALVVGIVGGVIVIAVVILIVFMWNRKKRRSGRVCCKLDDKETRSNQSVEPSKTHNGNSTDNSAKKNGHITPGAQNKGFEKNLNDEVTLVENDLYSAKSKPQIDPSDGGYASVNEIEAQGK